MAESKVAKVNFSNLSLRDAPRVFEAMRQVWREAGRLQTSVDTLPRLPELPVDEARVELFAKTVRGYLGTPATDREIEVALAVLAGRMKWPSNEIILDKPAYLTGMHETLKGKFAAAIIEQAVRASSDRYDWMLTPKELVEECKNAQRDVEAGVLFLEASPAERYPISYGLRMQLMSREEAVAQLRRARYLRRLGTR